jgi:hypothetical protein
MRSVSLAIITAALFLGSDLKRAAGVPRTRDEMFAVGMFVATVIVIAGGW